MSRGLVVELGPKTGSDFVQVVRVERLLRCQLIVDLFALGTKSAQKPGKFVEVPGLRGNGRSVAMAPQQGDDPGGSILRPVKRAMSPIFPHVMDLFGILCHRGIDSCQPISTNTGRLFHQLRSKMES